MSTTTEIRRPTARERFLVLIREAAADFAAAAPLSVPKADVQRAIDRVVLSFRAAAVSKPEMYECSPPSVARAIALCALTGLMPGGAVPEVDLIPRKSRMKNAEGNWVDGPLELQWQVGWRGYKTLAARAGCLAKPVLVFVGEAFEWAEGMESTLRHRPTPGARMISDVDTLAPLVCAYVVASYPDGRKDFLVLDCDGLAKRRNVSDGYRQWKAGRIKSTPWAEWPDEMALKTAMRYAATRGLLLLDDVARYAFHADGEEDAPRREAIDVTATPERVERPALADRGGLDELEADLLDHGPDEEPEPIPVAPAPPPVSTGKGPTKIDRKMPSPPKSNKPMPSVEDLQRAAAEAASKSEPEPLEGKALLDAMKEAEADAGEGYVERVRKGMGLNMTLSQIAVVERIGPEEARLYITRLENVTADWSGR